MHLLGSLDDLSVEGLLEQTNDEDKYVVETFLKNMENLVDRYIDIRREELGSPGIKYSLENIVFNNDGTLTAKYSSNGKCMCSSNCDYEYDDYDIGIQDLFLPEEKIREIFSSEKLKRLEKQTQQEKAKKDREERERQEKETAEKALLEQLKKKYEESR